ncbi:MAG: DUF5667 domain-containing protein [Patescibacteria group bacterium]
MSLIKNISHIKHLDSVQPDRRWRNTAKYDLLEEISSQNRLMQAYKLSNNQKIDLFVMRFINRLAPSMAKLMTVFLVFTMFFGVNIAAQASAPGDDLWPVKRAIEEGEVLVAFSPVAKAEIHIEHVGKRLKEIDKILQKPTNTETKVKKDKAIKQAISHLEKDVTSVDSALKIVKEEKSPMEVVELVKKVTDATKGVDNKLAEKKVEAQNTNDKELGKAIDSAKVLNKQVKKAAVEVAIEVHEELQKIAEDKAVLDASITDGARTNIDNTGSLETGTVDIVDSGAVEEVSPEEVEAIGNLVKEILASEISDLSEEVKDVKQKVEIVNEEALKTIKHEALGEENTEKIITAELDEFDVIKKESSQESEVVLEEAKVLLDNGMFKDVFNKVSEANEKYEKAEVTLKKIEEVIEVKQEIENQNPTIIETPNNFKTPSSPSAYLNASDQNIIRASAIDISGQEAKELETLVE